MPTAVPAVATASILTTTTFQNVRALSSQRTSHTELSATFLHQNREDTVHAENRQQERCSGKGDEHRRSEPPTHCWCAKNVCHSTYANDAHLWVSVR